MSDGKNDRTAEGQPAHTCTGAGGDGMRGQPCLACNRNFAATGDRFLTPEDAAFIKDHAPEPVRDTNEAQPSRLLSPTKTSAEARRIVRQGMQKYALDYLNEEPEDETGAEQFKILTSLLESVWDEGWEFCAAGRESVRDTVEGPPQERVTGEPGRCPAVHPGDGGRCIYGAGHSIEYHCDGGAKWDSSASSPTPDYDVLRLRLVRLESAAGFVVRRIELATSESLRDRIETLRKVLDDEDRRESPPAVFQGGSFWEVPGSARAYEEYAGELTALRKLAEAARRASEWFGVGLDPDDPHAAAGDDVRRNLRAAVEALPKSPSSGGG